MPTNYPPTNWKEAADAIREISRKAGVKKPKGPSLYERLTALESQMKPKDAEKSDA